MDNRALGDGAFLLSIKLRLKNYPHPGEFLHIRPTSEGSDPLLRRAFSIFDYDEQRGVVDVLYKVFGRGSAILSRVPAGHVLDLLGPLGNGFPLPDKRQRLIMVGGGVGIPPVYLLAKVCLMNGHPAEEILYLGGFSNANDTRMGERINTLPIKYEISTDDGSRGYRGFVTSLLKERLSGGWGGQDSIVYACGPEPMLRAVQNVTAECGVPCYFSLESIMPCGVGTCLGCVVKQAGEDKFLRVCREGPVFRSTEVEL